MSRAIWVAACAVTLAMAVLSSLADHEPWVYDAVFRLACVAVILAVWSAVNGVRHAHRQRARLRPAHHPALRQEG